MNPFPDLKRKPDKVDVRVCKHCEHFAIEGDRKLGYSLHKKAGSKENDEKIVKCYCCEPKSYFLNCIGALNYTDVYRPLFANRAYIRMANPNIDESVKQKINPKDLIRYPGFNIPEACPFKLEHLIS